MATDTPRDFALDADGDLDISTGDFTLTRGVEAIRQAIQIKLQFFQGEWFLDLTAGVPFYQSVLVKNPSPGVLQSVFRKAILEVPGVLEVTTLSITTNRATRGLTVTFTATTDVGELSDTQEI